MASATGAAALGRSITRISARAFTHPNVSGGGNPVTVFLSTASPADVLPPSTRSTLAKSCDWESVIAHLPPPAASEQGQKPILSFYMPSGEEVSFCAHAAIGAAAVISSERRQSQDSNSPAAAAAAEARQCVEFTTTTDDTTQIATISPQSGSVELCMMASHTEDDIPDFLSLGSIRDALGLRMEDVSLGGTGLPSYINTSIARNKTLFPMLDVNRLHYATNPRDAEEFRTLCDKIKSTGIYLYSPVDDDDGNIIPDAAKVDVTSTSKYANDESSRDTEEEKDVQVLRYECRQFPRASGYPEDPATGIAAAALAASLRMRGFGAPREDDEDDDKRYRYEFYQGTAMGRRSKIGVRFDEDESGTGKNAELKIYVSGNVEILSRDEEELPSS